MGEIGSKDLSTCLCLYQVPDYSVYQNKMYLTGGRPILDVWPKLAGNGLTCDNRGMIISDGQYSYVFFAGGTVLFNINTKDVVKSRPENPGYWLISTMAKMTYYKYAEPDAINMTKNIYGGDSVSAGIILFSNHMFCSFCPLLFSSWRQSQPASRAPTPSAAPTLLRGKIKLIS